MFKEKVESERSRKGNMSGTMHLHFEMVESIVMLCEECQSPDGSEEERHTALFIA